MKHRLPRARAHVEHCPISLLDVPLARDLRRRQVTPANPFRIFSLRFLQSGEMLLWDYKHVCRRLRIDVFKSKYVLVLVNFLCRNLATENAAEKAVAARVGHRWITMAETITLESTACQRGASTETL